MRARADADVVEVVPVAEVVLTTVRLASTPVRDLVLLVARADQELVRELVHVGDEILVGHRELPSLGPAEEYGAGLDGQRVQGKVLGLERECPFERVAPDGERLVW